MKDIVLYSSKRYMVAMAAALLLFAGVSIYHIIYAHNISGRNPFTQLFRSITPEIFYVIAPLSSVLFIYVCSRLLKPTPSVIINREGIFDNASVLGAGMIRWEEINSMFIYKVMDNFLLGIIPVNMETILARQSIIKRFFFRICKGISPAPFAIPEGGLPMSVEELLVKIQLYRESLSQDRGRCCPNKEG
jgi:hypothetical protein